MLLKRVLASAGGYVMYYFSNTAVAADASTVLASLTVGLIGGIYCRFSKTPPVVAVLSGIFLLVCFISFF